MRLIWLTFVRDGDVISIGGAGGLKVGESAEKLATDLIYIFTRSKSVFDC
jgi:hypothetical protein